jgi:hypothetical protein
MFRELPKMRTCGMPRREAVNCVDKPRCLGTVAILSPFSQQADRRFLQSQSEDDPMASRKRPHDGYENALDHVIAQCDGDVHGALKALLAANEYLEAELCSLRAAIATGAVPVRATLRPRMPSHRSHRVH